MILMVVQDTNDVLKAQDAEGRGAESPRQIRERAIVCSVLDKGNGPSCQKKKLLSFTCQKKKLLSFMNVTLIWIMRLSTLLGYMPIP